MRPSTRLTRTDNLVPYTTLVRSGTVLLVSHDREFLNNVVTQTLAAEEGGHWREYVGGYDEWLEQRPAPIDEGPLTKPRKKEAADGSKSKTEKTGKNGKESRRENGCQYG